MTDTLQGIAQEEQLEVKLRLRMQGEAEPVEAYVQDVLNLCYKIDHDMLARSKIKHVLRGLKPSLLEKVMIMTNDTLPNLMSKIWKLEMARFMAGQRVDHLLADPLHNVHVGSFGGTAAEGSDVRKLEGKLESLTSEFTKLRMRLLEQGQRTSQGAGPHNYRNQQRRSYLG